MSVHPIALGTMMFGAWGNPDAAQCRRMVDIALDRGVTLIDTADIYDFGASEEILGEALAGRRDDVVLATKVGNAMSDDPLQRGLSRRWIRQSCEDSLRRLRTDRIDLYQMHRPDPDTPIEESLGALDELVAEGKVRAVGTSTFSVEQLAAAQRGAGERNLVRPATEQPPYSILCRGIEREVLPWCAANDVGVIVWAPLNGGWLTGKYQLGEVDSTTRAVREAEHFDHRDAAMRERKIALVDRLGAIADGAGVSLLQLALGFVIASPAVTAAIIGPRTPEQLEALLDASDAHLFPDVLAAIDEVVAPGATVNPADDG